MNSTPVSAPKPVRRQEWKDVLNWYFKKGREVLAVLLRGVPPCWRA